MTDSTPARPSPAKGVIVEAVRVAGLAPSLHNSQPWRWVLSGSALHLFGVPERQLASADPTGREYRISLGVALDHLRMALDAAGWSSVISVSPDPSDPDHIAMVEFGEQHPVTPAAVARVGAIAERHSHRLPMDPPREFQIFAAYVPGLLATTAAARAGIAQAGISLSEVAVSDLITLAEASRVNDLERSYDWRYHSELSWWTGTSAASIEGVPATALVTENEYEAVGVARRFPKAIRPGAAPAQPDAARVLVLDSAGDEPGDHIACGRALSTLLIEAHLRGLATCVVSHLTEMPASRAMVCALLGEDPLRCGRYPQILVRLGTARDGLTLPPSNRRPVDDIFDEDVDAQLEWLFATPVPLWPLLRGA